METKDKVGDLKKVLEGKKKEAPKEATSEEALSTIEQELKETHEKWLRTMADFDNYKKRIHKEQLDIVQYSAERFVKELLPILDSFNRIFDHFPEKPTDENKALIDGTKLIYANFMKCLKTFQVEEIPATGEPFDPHWHEAIAQVKSEEKSGTVIECHRKGYKLHDRLLRPAMVTVSK